MLIEGDAVLTETLLTNKGRGRDPAFLLYEKVKFLNDEKTKYANFLYEDWYSIGYLFNIHIRKNYGIKTFKKLFERKNWYDDLGFFHGYKNFRILADNIFDRFYPLSVNHRLKKFTGKNFKELFFDIKKDLRKKWNQQLENLKISEFEKVNKETQSYCNPQKFNDGIIALKISKVDFKTKQEFIHFVFLKDGKEQWLKKFDFSLDDVNFSCAGNKIIFQGSKKKLRNAKLPRHLKEADNAIFILDGNKKSIGIIDKFPHCKHPIFSPSAEKIIFFSPDDDGTPTLVMLDGKNFKILKRYKLEKFHLYRHPIFSPDDEKILFIDSFDGESRIKVIDGEEIKEIYKSKHILRGLAENENFIFFGSSLSGIDNIYALEKESSKVFQVTSSKYGAYRPHVVGDFLVYNDYNENCCYDVAKIKISRDQWTPIEVVEDRNIYLFEDLQNQEEKTFTIQEIFEQETVENFEIKDYEVFPLYDYYLNLKIFPKIFSKRFRDELAKDFRGKYFYSSWFELKFYDYYSGISFWTKYKSNEKHDLINLGVGYTFFDKHEINFETTIFDHHKYENKFFNENVLDYVLILKNFLGKNFYSFRPGVEIGLKNKKRRQINLLGKINFEFDTYRTVNKANFSLERSGIFLENTFNYSFDKKNSILLSGYVFKIDFEGIKKNSSLCKILENHHKVSIIEKISKKSLSRKKRESIKDFRQFGFSLGYKYLLPLDYSLESLADEFYCLFLKSVEIFPEVKVDITMFSSNEYSLICNCNVSVLRAITMHTKFGAMLKENKICATPFDWSFSCDLSPEKSNMM
jgi:Tol biopolymer transport system component